MIVDRTIGEIEMTNRTAETSPLIYARVAGFTFLFYIAVGVTSLVLADRTHATDVVSVLQSKGVAMPARRQLA